MKYLVLLTLFGLSACGGEVKSGSQAVSESFDIKISPQMDNDSQRPEASINLLAHVPGNYDPRDPTRVKEQERTDLDPVLWLPDAQKTAYFLNWPDSWEGKKIQHAWYQVRVINLENYNDRQLETRSAYYDETQGIWFVPLSEWVQRFHTDLKHWVHLRLMLEDGQMVTRALGLRMGEMLQMQNLENLYSLQKHLMQNASLSDQEQILEKSSEILLRRDQMTVEASDVQRLWLRGRVDVLGFRVVEQQGYQAPRKGLRAYSKEFKNGIKIKNAHKLKQLAHAQPYKSFGMRRVQWRAMTLKVYRNGALLADLDLSLKDPAWESVLVHPGDQIRLEWSMRPDQKLCSHPGDRQRQVTWTETILQKYKEAFFGRNMSREYKVQRAFKYLEKNRSVGVSMSGTWESQMALTHPGVRLRGQQMGGMASRELFSEKVNLGVLASGALKGSLDADQMSARFPQAYTCK